MKTHKELREAINTIMDYCHSQTECELCPLFVIDFGCMFLDEAIPLDWDATRLEEE